MKKNKNIIKKLNKLGKEDSIKVTIELYKKCLLETCYHNGYKFDKKFSCDTETIWRGATLVCNTFGVEDLIKLLEHKDINEMEDSDFPELEIVYTSDGGVEVTNIEWETPLTEEEESDFNPMDLYWDSEITDSELSFGENSIFSMVIEHNENIVARIVED